MFLRSLFSDNLLKLRKYHDLSLAQASSIINITRASLNQIESGKIMPQFTTLINLANLYGVSIDWLMERKDSFPYESEILVSLEFDLWRNVFSNYTNSHPQSPSLPMRVIYDIDDAIDMSQDITSPYLILLMCAIIEQGNKEKFFTNYKSIEGRVNFYSLSARANIIFCLQILKFFTNMITAAEVQLNIQAKQKSVTEYLANEEGEWDRWLPVLYSVESKRAANTWFKLAKKCYAILCGYLVADDNGDYEIDPDEDIFAPVYEP